VKSKPFGGGFMVYLGNELRFETVETDQRGANQDVEAKVHVDRARAFHSSYFEMLGEQGWPGLILWLMIHVTGLFRMEAIYRRFRNQPPDQGRWMASLAGALQQAHFVYLAGALFVGIAFQPFVYMLVGLQIGLDVYASRQRKESDAPTGFRRSRPAEA
jgi:hypothetical protein